MPIHFPCSGCQERLSIGKRKAGTEITCPKCGKIQIVPVPGQEPPPPPEELFPAPPPPHAMEDIDAPIPPPPLGSAPQWPDPPPLPEDEEDLVPAVLDKEEGEKRVVEMPPQIPPLVNATVRPRTASTVAVRQSTLAVMACLVLGLLAGTFVAGYYTGLGRRGGVEAGSGSASADAEAVLVEGRATYQLANGRSEGDAGAVFIAIPVNATPEPKIPSFGLRPRDPAPRSDNEDVARIEALGGFYVRTDALGECPLVFPQPGRYHLLVISCRAIRPAVTGIDELDTEAMKRCFFDPATIIGGNRYRWMTRAVAPGTEPIEIDFGTGPILGGG